MHRTSKFDSAYGARRRASHWRSGALALVAGLMVLGAPALALAHAVVFPRESTPGAYEKYVLRVPNERDVATTKVEMTFPAGVRVISFADVEGWDLEVVTDSAQRIVGAIWTGTLPAARFVEFPFIAVNPTEDANIVWPAYQTYADGDRVAWTGPEDSKSPASVTVVSGGASSSGDGPNSSVALYIALGAALLALISLGLMMRPRTDS